MQRKKELRISIQEKDYYLFPSDRAHKKTLIWLHGLGDTADGFLPVFKKNILDVNILINFLI